MLWEYQREGVRDGWAAYDLETSDGIKVEVKSAAYVQGWHQEKLSSISFGISKTRRWNDETNKTAQESRRQADVYVFALLAHQDKATIDPLNLDHWHFYSLPAATLNSKAGSQYSISLKTLQKLSGSAVNYKDLGSQVRSIFSRPT